MKRDNRRDVRNTPDLRYARKTKRGKKEKELGKRSAQTPRRREINYHDDHGTRESLGFCCIR